jgi:hypothetical protein
VTIHRAFRGIAVRTNRNYRSLGNQVCTWCLYASLYCDIQRHHISNILKPSLSRSRGIMARICLLACYSEVSASIPTVVTKIKINKKLNNKSVNIATNGSKTVEPTFGTPCVWKCNIRRNISVMNRDRSDSIATGYGMDGRGLIPGKRQETFLCSTRPRRLRDPPSLISNGYRSLFPREQSDKGMKLTTRLHLLSRWRMVELYLHKSLWRSH